MTDLTILFLLILAIFSSTDCKVAMTGLTQLMDPCLFPLPNSPYFSAICQSDYHEVPWLCDPSGLLSRTEAEILQTKFSAKKSVQFRNISSCFCDKLDCFLNDRLKIAVILVPYSSVSSVHNCLSLNPFAAMLNSKTYTLSSAALAYAREISRRWSGSCQADLFIVYIQSWRPENFKRPFIITLYQNNLDRLSQMPDIRAVPLESTVFDAILNQFNDAHFLINELFARRLIHRTSTAGGTTWTDSFDSWGSVGGVPLWAYALGSSLVLLVLVTFYIGNILTRKLVVQQKQIQKKQAISSSMRLANERWKTGSIYSPVPGQGTPRPVKSTMMFRQFSGERRSKTKQWAPRQI